MKEAGHNPTENHILSIIGKICLLPYENMHTQPPQLRTGLMHRKVQHINNVNFQHRVSQKHILLLSPNRDANVSNTTECFQHFVSPEIKWSVQTVSGQQNASNQLQETGKLLSFWSYLNKRRQADSQVILPEVVGLPISQQMTCDVCCQMTWSCYSTVRIHQHQNRAAGFTREQVKTMRWLGTLSWVFQQRWVN